MKRTFKSLCISVLSIAMCFSNGLLLRAEQDTEFSVMEETSEVIPESEQVPEQFEEVTEEAGPVDESDSSAGDQSESTDDKTYDSPEAENETIVQEEDLNPEEYTSEDYEASGLNTSPEESEAAVAEAKAAMEAAAETVSAAEADLSAAEKRLADAKTALETAYDEGVLELTDNAEYQAAAETAQQSGDALKKAEEDTVKAAENIVTAKTALEEAKKARDEKHAVHEEKLGKLSDANSALADAKKAYEEAAASRDTAKANVDQNAKAIEEAKAAYDAAAAEKKSLEDELEQVKSEITDYDHNIEDARAAYESAVASYQEAKKQVGLGSIGFFHEREDSQGASRTIDDLLEESYRRAIRAGIKDTGLTNIGAENDATSLDNMKLAISYMYECNELRASDDHNSGEDKLPLQVTDVMMLGAQVDANYASEDYNHWMGFGGDGNGQILANMFYDRDPYQAWYTKEKAVYDAGRSGNTGHYKIIANPEGDSLYRYSVTGLGVNTVHYNDEADQNGTRTPYKTWMQNFGTYTTLNAKTWSLEDYDAAFTEYYNRVKGALSDAEMARDTAKNAFLDSIDNNTGMSDEEKAELKALADIMYEKNAALSDKNDEIARAEMLRDMAQKALTESENDLVTATAEFEEAYNSLTPEKKEAYDQYAEMVAEVVAMGKKLDTMNQYTQEYLDLYNEYREIINKSATFMEENELNYMSYVGGNVDTANDRISRSTAYLNTAEETLNTLTSERDALNSEITTAADNYKTALMNSGATAEQKEKILKLKEDIENTTNTMNEKSAALETAESETADLTDALADAESAVSTAEETVTDAEKAVSDAETEVNEAKADLDAAEAEVENAEKAVPEAEMNLEKAQEAEEEARRTHEADEANVEATVKRLSRIYYDAVHEVNQAEEDLTAAKERLENAKTAYNEAVIKYNEAVKTDEEVKADVAAAEKVSSAIALLDKELTLEDKAAVENARSAYEGLTDVQKAYVTNLSVLTEAEDRIQVLEKEAADQNAAAAVDALISGIEGADIFQLEEKIVAAETAYDELTDDQKALVKNYEVLRNWRINLDKAKADKTAADKVTARIALLDRELTLADKASVTEARSAYDQLTDDQKAYVGNLDVLANAEKKIKELETAVENQKAADAVKDLIDRLPDIDDLTEDDHDAVSAARKAYDDLNDDQKKLVDNEQQLIDLEKKIEDLIKSASGVWVKNVKDQLVQQYTGSAVKLSGYEVYFGKKLLKENTDYKVTYRDNKNAGTAQMSIAMKGSYAKFYEGNTVIEFTIEPVDLGTDDRIRVDDITAKYTGKNQTAKPVVYFNGKKLSAKNQYRITQPVMNQEGSYTVTIEGLGKNFTGSKEITYTIISPENSQMMSKTTVKIPAVTVSSTAEDLISLFKDGKAFVRDGKKTLIYGTDYIIECEDRFEKAGTGYAVIRGTETVSAVTGKAYYGEKSAAFKITGTKITDQMVSLEYSSKEYTGSAVCPTVTISGLRDSDYEVSYQNNTNTGTASVLITGKGNYTGTVRKTFKITKADASDAFAISCPESAEYKAGGSRSSAEVTDARTHQLLKEGIDYKLSYSNNKAVTSDSTVKKPAVKVTGLGNYKGSQTAYFTITAADMSDMVISAPDTAYKNSRGNWKTALKVLNSDGKALSAKSDYTAVYTCNGEVLTAASSVNAGDVITVTVTGKGKYSSSINAEYRVLEKAEVRNLSSVRVEVDPVRYTGTELTPKVTVTAKDGTVLKEGTDYEISGYANHINPGKNALVILRGIGNWSGTKVQKFTIRKTAEDTWWSNVINALTH